MMGHLDGWGRLSIGTGSGPHFNFPASSYFSTASSVAAPAQTALAGDPLHFGILTDEVVTSNISHLVVRSVVVTTIAVEKLRSRQQSNALRALNSDLPSPSERAVPEPVEVEAMTHWPVAGKKEAGR
jgi:hypothetical protein